MAPQREPLIDFLIIGGAKCATTWLQASLSANRSVFMPAPELHFFSREFHRGRRWYDAHFTDASPGDLIGEKSNSYLTQPEAAERIAAAFPDVRLVVQMRNPVERAYSDYCMLFRRGEVSADIQRHLDPEIAGEERFLDDGRYAHHIDRFLRFFDRGQILLLAYEDIAENPEAQMRLVADHIGVDGTLVAPMKEKVKDRAVSVVPRPIRNVLAPFRPVLDPLRELGPMRTLRNAVARPVDYPPLTPDLAAKMAQYFLQDVDRLRALAPNVVARWQHPDDPTRLVARA